MFLTIQRRSDIPLYRQVVDQIGELIRRGTLTAGDRLPTVRELAREAGLTRLTVQTAYTELQAQGLIESFVGRGTFVAARPLRPVNILPRSIPQSPVSWTSQGLFAEMVQLMERSDMISFAHTFPAPETYPLREFNRALRETTTDPAVFGYGFTQGDVLLREQICRLLLERGIDASPDQVLITNGTQHGISLALQALITAGDIILVEEPTYPGVLEIAAQRGQRVVSMPMDDEGADLASMEAICTDVHPRLFYTIPTYHNPAGVTYSAGRRSQVLQIARRHGMLVIEDDVYGFLSFDGPALPALKAEDPANVVYLTGFSKTFMPALRMGAAIADAGHLARLTMVKRNEDLTSSLVLQRALATYLRRGHLGAHLQYARALYSERRDAMLAALARYTQDCQWTRPAGGLCLWLALPPGVDEGEVYHELLRQGIGVSRGQAFYPQPQATGHLRLSYGAQPPERIEQGVAAIGRVIQQHALAAARAQRELSPLV